MEDKSLIEEFYRVNEECKALNKKKSELKEKIIKSGIVKGGGFEVRQRKSIRLKIKVGDEKKFIDRAEESFPDFETLCSFLGPRDADSMHSILKIAPDCKEYVEEVFTNIFSVAKSKKK